MADWAYETNLDGSVTITGYKGKSTSAIVPERIAKRKVSIVTKDAFSPDALYIHKATRDTRKKLEEIVVPTGVSFQPSVDDIPKGIKRLHCPDMALDSIIMPNSTLRGRRCYVQGLTLKDLTEIESTDPISDYCFENGILFNREKTALYFWLPAVPLQEVCIPDSVTSISGYAFRNGNFDSVFIPDSVTKIDNSAFYACKSKKLVIGGGIPEPQTSIFGWSIISSMPCLMSFSEIEFREGIKVIPQCFGKMKELTRVILPKSITSFPDKSFYYRPDIKTEFFDYLDRGEPADLTMVVYRDSYAEQYALENGYTVEYRE